MVDFDALMARDVCTVCHRTRSLCREFNITCLSKSGEHNFLPVGGQEFKYTPTPPEY